MKSVLPLTERDLWQADLQNTVIKYITQKKQPQCRKQKRRESILSPYHQIIRDWLDQDDFRATWIFDKLSVSTAIRMGGHTRVDKCQHLSPGDAPIGLSWKSCWIIVVEKLEIRKRKMDILNSNFKYLWLYFRHWSLATAYLSMLA